MYRWPVSNKNSLNCVITAASAHNSHPSQTVTTQNQEDSSWTDFFDPISHPMGRGHPTETKIGNNL